MDHEKFDLLKSHVEAFTRKNGSVVQAHDDKRVAASKAPKLSFHAKALRASSKEGDYDHDRNQNAADAMEADDHQDLKRQLSRMDTAARDHILDHVHPDHRPGLGFEQINPARSMQKYEQKFGKKK